MIKIVVVSTDEENNRAEMFVLDDMELKDKERTMLIACTTPGLRVSDNVRGGGTHLLIGAYLLINYKHKVVQNERAAYSKVGRFLSTPSDFLICAELISDYVDTGDLPDTFDIFASWHKKLGGNSRKKTAAELAALFEKEPALKQKIEALKEEDFFVTPEQSETSE